MKSDGIERLLTSVIKSNINWEKVCFGKETWVLISNLPLPNFVTMSNLLNKMNFSFPSWSMPTCMAPFARELDWQLHSLISLYHTQHTRVCYLPLKKTTSHTRKSTALEKVNGTSETCHALTCLCNLEPSCLFLKKNE